MRYSVSSLDYEYTLKYAGIVGGKEIKEARNCGLVFAELAEYQANLLKNRGLIVRPIHTVRHCQVGVPRKVEPSGAGPFTGLELSHAAAIRELRHLYDPPISGSEYNIAFLDTGIRASHEGFKDRVIYNKNYSDSPTYEDVFGHGTSVAWVAAGGGPEGEEQGIVPKVGMLNLKVLNDEGEGTEEAVVIAIDELIEMKKNNDPNTPLNINMSLGTPDDGDPDNPVRVACRAAHDNLIATGAACGNGGPTPQTILCPATDPIVWSIGSVSPMSGIISNFSSRGPTLEGEIKPDAVFFGDDMILADSESDKSYAVKAGTSFATPFIVALGVAGQECYDRAGELGISLPGIPGALYLEEGEYIMDFFRAHLEEACVKPEGVPLGKDNDYGYGIVLGSAALEAFRKEVIGGVSMVGGITTILVPIMFILMMGSMMKSVVKK